jgi:pilus assembly protein CpaB
VKRISPATVTFGVMAVVLGLVAAYTVRQALSKPPIVERPAPPPPAPEMVPVVYALNVIPKHTRLTARDVFIGQVPKGTKLPEGVFRGVNLVEGRITKDTIAPGRMLRNGMLLGLDEAMPDLADRLPTGHRAVTIMVQGADTGGKRLAEGDYIDIAMTVEGTHPDLGELTTRTLMRKVLVVDAANSQPLVRGSRTTKAPTSSMITVAVLPADANKLIVAQRTGDLQATLVSAAEHVAADAPANDSINRRQLLGLKEIVPPKKYNIEKWSGSNFRIIEMSDDRVRESRAVSAAPRQLPVAQPAPDANDFGRNIPSGVRLVEGDLLVSEQPQAALPPTHGIER